MSTNTSNIKSPVPETVNAGLTVKEISRKNGQIVVNVIKKNNNLATMQEIAQEISTLANLDPELVKSQVKKILNNGVNGGFIFKEGQKYTIEPPEIDEEEEYPAPNERSRSSRRARSRSRSRRRSARRSRRRRRR